MRYLVLIACLLIPGWVSGQVYSLNIGYNFSAMRPNGMNFLVDRYNETRNYLDVEMEPFGTFTGISYSAGFYFALFYTEVGYLNRSQTRFAEGTDQSGTYNRRDLRAAINTGNFSLGITIPLEDAGLFIIPYGRMDIGKLRVRTRVGPADDIRSQDWIDPVNEIYSDFSAGIRFMVPGFIIEPYYSMGPIFGFEVNVADANASINPATAVNDRKYIPFEPFEGRGGAFGIRMMIALTNMADFL